MNSARIEGHKSKQKRYLKIGTGWWTFFVMVSDDCSDNRTAVSVAQSTSRLTASGIHKSRRSTENSIVN